MSAVVIVGQKPLPLGLVNVLRTRFGALRLPSDPAERAVFVAEHADEITVAVTSAGVGVDAQLMELFPKLRFIANFGVGYDSTDVVAASERGIVVTNTPEVLDDAVADLAVGLMIDVMRGMSESDRFVRAGRWEQGAFPLRQEVTGAKVGILGLGRIGEQIAARLAGFRCEIRYHNRTEKPGVEFGYARSVRELAAWADVLVVATPGGAATRALVDVDVLRELGPHGYLVNIARGSVVDESALIEALRSGGIAGAGLDVFADEPRVPDALKGCDNVVLTPHLASSTEQTRRAMADLVLANVEAVLAGQSPLTPVN